MKEKELKLASYLLNLAGDEFCNHGCNDVEDSVYEGWTLEERKQFVKEFHEWNGDPEEYNENFLHLGDDVLMDYLADKLSDFASQSSPAKDVSDEDIEKAAEIHATFIGYDEKPNINIAKQVSFTQGAKALRDGHIPAK
jgi:hypothetical protein